MKRLYIFFLLNCFVAVSWAQANDTDTVGVVMINKDPRIDILGRKMAEYNESLATKLRTARGYRLMLLSTNDRNQALQVRTQLMQYFPDQTTYMIFQSPFIKLKFGNFLDKSEAEDYRKQITSLGIVKSNIYILPETIEVKAEKLLEKED